jgi:two-component system, chemotaxis family, chemotaxis protein CheY
MAKILVVDDAQFLRVRLSKLLKEHGYDVSEASNGAEAVAAYQNIKPDAVLMDITMPEKDGLEALAEIRGNDPQAKVLMLTALGQESMVIRAVQNGAKDFIVKPFEPERVLNALKKVLG